MNKVAKIAVASAVAMVLASSMVVADDAKPQNSVAAGKDLQAALKDMHDRKWDDMLGELDKVKNNPKKNDYDEHVMNELYAMAYTQKKQLQDATGPVEHIIVSKYTPPEELKKRVVQAASMFEDLKNYDKALEYGNRAIKDGYGTPAVDLIVAQSYYLKNDFKDTDRFVHGVVDNQLKAGQMPSDEMLQLGLSSASKLNNSAGESHWLELLVTYHPKPEYWQNLLAGMFNAKLSDRQLLQVYRLSAEVGAMKRGSDYAEMAQLSLDEGSPGEAVSVLTKGFANNVFTEPADKNRNQHLLDSAKKQVAADQPTLAKMEADAESSPGGDKLVSTGIGYFGYGDYAKSAKDLSDGIAKGPTKDAQDARLLLGIAQYKAGSKDEAVKTFKSVKGDPTLERLAALWALRVKGGAG
jgi:tetratricopeptide (TPR) repeat protein